MSWTPGQIEQIPEVYRDFMLVLKPIPDSGHHVSQIDGIPLSKVFNALRLKYQYEPEQVRTLAENLKRAGFIEEDQPVGIDATHPFQECRAFLGDIRPVHFTRARPFFLSTKPARRNARWKLDRAVRRALGTRRLYSQHNSAAYYSLVGHQPPADLVSIAASASDFPAYGSVVSKLAPSRQRVPTFVSLALGSAYFREARFIEAEREYRATVLADPKAGEAWNNLAALYLMTGRGEEAERAVASAEKVGYAVNPALKADIRKRKSGS